MFKEKANYALSWMAPRLGVSVSGYYRYLYSKPSVRRLDEQKLSMRIKAIFCEHKGRYGSPRITYELKKQGKSISVKRTARLMREQGLVAVSAAKRRPKTTLSNSKHPKADNVLARDFTAVCPNEKWAGDITYIRTTEGWLYLAVLLDVFSRKVIGYQMGTRVDTDLALGALQSAIEQRGLKDGLIHHTDRGSTYTAHRYQNRLDGCIISMSRKGNCWDNAISESFFATLEKELLMQNKPQNTEATIAMVFEYIQIYYNTKRMHSSIGYQTPQQCEDNFYADLAA